MPETLSGFWTWFIAIPTIAGLVGLFLLVRWLSGRTTRKDESVETMGHVWDEDLEEYNNPLPRWWLILFYLSLLFAAIYLLLYPGLGAFGGLLGWTQIKQYEAQVAAAEARYGPLYEQYSEQSIATLATNPEAVKMGERLYASYCSVCHGADARGATGFPDLTDNAWLYGGNPEAIETSILNGRSGTMPAWEGALGEEGVEHVTQYVLSLSGRDVDTEAAQKGAQAYATYCVSCHGPQGKGNQAIGAPDLTDDNWLYGGSPRAVAKSIAKGRQGNMPAHQEFLGKDKVHVLAAYIYHVSRADAQTASAAPTRHAP